jgi:hypothetical protein
MQPSETHVEMRHCHPAAGRRGITVTRNPFCSVAMEEVPSDNGQPTHLSDSAVISAAENR